MLLTSVGRAMSLTQRVARKLDHVPDVMDMDVNDDEQIAAVAAEVSKRWGKLDGACTPSASCRRTRWAATS